MAVTCTYKIFEQVDFNKKHKTQSFKPLNFSCVLKLSKAQTEEKAFKDGLIDQLYELLMDHLKVHSHSIGFPELVLPAVLQLKAFLKKCKIANYCKQIKQIVDKIDENSKFITQKRKYVNFTLENDNAVDAWERKIKDEGTPISKFYKAWRVLRDKEIQHEISGKDRLTDVTELPTIKRPKGPIKPTDEEKKEFSALFDSDSEDSQDDETRFKADKVKNKKKKIDVEEDDDDDSVEDFSGDNLSEYDSDELEQLAESASEDDDDDEDIDDDDDDDPESNEESDEPRKVETKVKTKPKPPSVNRMERKRKLLQEGQGISDVVKEFKLDDF
ncbi:hypothetical protein LOTGIDRAFT_228791 [Lottia gigantea]|uniref:Uncharacterized protein n=1 Tax=Lottia gigantea TaxID=225164 RepID=V4A8I9_LOTGI|nr:hypothetical protein LOTGIDRAFT_228791 [Lottia gigantea]ESO91330.1 hypothetical protein LOTGIDRAFT_228791 [Lottia gigantea]